MNKAICIFCCSMVIITGLTVYADSVSSVISADGAIWASSSIIGQTGTYAANLFTTDFGMLIRSLQTGEDNSVKTKTNLNSSGSLGIDEYTFHEVNSSLNPEKCIFAVETTKIPGLDKIEYTGLLQTGRYDSTRVIDGKTRSDTIINGTGLILSRAESMDENHTENYQSDAAGNLSMSENIEFGGE